MTPRDLPALTIAGLQNLLRRREVSPREALEALHARIAEVDPRIGAYLGVDLNVALQQAEAVDVTLPLGGVPIAIKDIINIAGQPCTCASRMLRDYRATLRCHGDPAAAGGGGDSLWPHEPRRVRDGFFDGELERVQPTRQPVGSHAGAGRIERRLRGRGGGG